MVLDLPSFRLFRLVFGQQAVKRGAAHAENFSRLDLVTAHALKNAQRVTSLNLFQRNEFVLFPRAFRDSRLEALRQVSDINCVALDHHAGMPEDILQLADVPGPAVTRQDALGTTRAGG